MKQSGRFLLRDRDERDQNTSIDFEMHDGHL